MLAALSSTPLPELAAYGLVVGIPLALTVLVWPLLRPRQAAATSKPPADWDSALLFATGGLPGQWAARSRQLEAGFERQRAAMTMHRNVAVHLGAIDHEIDRLWRDLRVVIEPLADPR